jgi:hypothetical protein
LGVDEHIWRPSRIGVDRAVTIMVDLTRDLCETIRDELGDAVAVLDAFHVGKPSSPGVWRPATRTEKLT